MNKPEHPVSVIIVIATIGLMLYIEFELFVRVSLIFLCLKQMLSGDTDGE